ncbi:NRDE-2, necessary for RNA interference-domain-containing protein [Limtongia smithiae]|uniref:NRDE-2, necessary for RNA interference-domain-containing protein n=1 Tax=Limtongia smithiae TaxID=1125753 RepID=UPI0034CFAC9C
MSDADDTRKQATSAVPKFSSFKPRNAVTGSTSAGSSERLDRERRHYDDPHALLYRLDERRDNQYKSQQRNYRRDDDRASRRQDILSRRRESRSPRRRRSPRRSSLPPSSTRSPPRSDSTTTAPPVKARDKSALNTVLRNDALPTVITSSTPSSALYVVDTFMDTNNLIYGKPAKVPLYNRFGRGHVLGLPREFRIDPVASETSGGIVITEGRARHDEEKVRRAWALSTKTKRVKISKDRDLHEDEFVPLSSSKYVPHVPVQSEFTLEDEHSHASSDEETSGEESFDDHATAAQSVFTLSKAVAEFPGDAQAWFDLAAAMTTNAPAEASFKSHIEIEISVFKKAISTNPGDTRLTLRYLELYELLHGNYQVAKLWKEVLERYPDNLQFWIAWLDFNVRDASSFKYSAALSRIVDVLSRIQRRVKEKNGETNLLYLIMRACRFIYDAGYTEHAIAIVQSLLHLNFMAPTSGDRMEWLSDFWTSEQPRIGDDIPNVEAERDANVTRWIDKELVASKRIFPVQIDSADANEDPFRAIVFEDVQPFMHYFSTSTLRTNVLWAVLEFCGCNTGKWAMNDVQFLERWPTDSGIVLDTAFVDRVIKTITSYITDLDFLVWTLEWTYTLHGVASLKAAKSLLKVHTQCIKLWCTYASLEYRLGNFERANMVFANAVKFLKDDEEAIRLWSGWMEMCVFETVVEDGKVLEILAGITEGHIAENVGSKKILATRNMLGSMMHRFLSARKDALAESAVKALAVLDYLSSDHDITRAMEVYDNFASSISSYCDKTRTVSAGCMYFFACLIRHEMSRAAFFKVSTLRAFLERCIGAYPCDVKLLRMYIANESKYRVQNNVSDLLNNVVLANGGVSVGVWHVVVEYALSIGSENVARSYFERAVAARGASSSTTRENVSVWRAYVAFEREHRSVHNYAKKVLFRGIAACPWARDLLLDAFGSFDDNITAGELKILGEVMMEREVRMRVALPEDEFGVQPEVMQNIPVDEDSVDEDSVDEGKMMTEDVY